LARASLSRYSITGLQQGSVGGRNYARLLEQDALGPVAVNTLVWVGAVVGVTLLISLALAQLLAVQFPGRRLVRWALIVPWAAVLNLIYVFNSFPIVWTLNDRNPGFGHDTLITYMYKVAFKSALRDVGLAAALGVVNVLLTLAAVLVYLRAARWREAQEA